MFKNALLRLFFLSLSLFSCQSGAILTSHSFDAIVVGSDISQIQSHYGTPYQITTNTQGFQEYLYIERIDIAHNVSDQIHYVLIVLDGKIIDKRTKTSGKSSLNFRTP